MSLVEVVKFFFAIDDGLDELASVMDRICPDTRVFSGCLFLKFALI